MKSLCHLLIWLLVVNKWWWYSRMCHMADVATACNMWEREEAYGNISISISSYVMCCGWFMTYDRHPVLYWTAFCYNYQHFLRWRPRRATQPGWKRYLAASKATTPWQLPATAPGAGNAGAAAWRWRLALQPAAMRRWRPRQPAGGVARLASERRRAGESAACPLRRDTCFSYQRPSAGAEMQCESNVCLWCVYYWWLYSEKMANVYINDIIWREMRESQAMCHDYMRESNKCVKKESSISMRNVYMYVNIIW